MSKARECGAKQRHDTKAAAEAHVWSLVKAGTRRSRMQVYRCRHCGAWHVGHKRRNR